MNSKEEIIDWYTKLQIPLVKGFHGGEFIKRLEEAPELIEKEIKNEIPKIQSMVGVYFGINLLIDEDEYDNFSKDIRKSFEDRFIKNPSEDLRLLNDFRKIMVIVSLKNLQSLDTRRK